MSRCERCDGIASQWGAVQCQYCNYPYPDTRTIETAEQDRKDYVERMREMGCDENGEYDGNYGEDMDNKIEEPTNLTRDQAIRAKALELAILSSGDCAKIVSPRDMCAISGYFAKYIKNDAPDYTNEKKQAKYDKADNFHHHTDGYELSVRTSTALDLFILERFDRAIKTPEEFCELANPTDFLKTPNVGRKSLNELRLAFSENGIKWDGRKGDE